MLQFALFLQNKIYHWHFEAVHTGTNSARESINPYLQLHVANDGGVEIMALAKARTTDADSVAVGGRRTDVLLPL